MIPRKPEESAFLKALIHSPAGHGKTHLLGTAQEDERTYPMAFLNFEAGESSLAGLDIDVFDIKTWADYNEVYAQLSAKGNGGYKSVGVDSITETQVAGLLEILASDGKRADPDQLAQQDWGIILVKMRRFVRHFVKMLPMHVLMTALSKDDTIARVGQVKVPAVQGGFAAELPGIFDVVGYLALEDNPDGGPATRLLLLNGYPKFSCKARTPWGSDTPNEIENPTVGKLLDTLHF